MKRIAADVQQMIQDRLLKVGEIKLSVELSRVSLRLSAAVKTVYVSECNAYISKTYIKKKKKKKTGLYF